MTWTGRQLTALTQNGETVSYKYDTDGLRLEKTANGITTEYQYVNGQLLGEKRSTGVVLRYTYDPLGALSSIQYTNGGGTWHNYYVRCTLSGDVDQIYSGSGNLVARYVYDTWGNTVSITDANGNAITSSTHIANINSIRYRGYYWDRETGFYYLQSRYYDPETKRLVNADSLLGVNGDGAQYNLFSYCGNNPVNSSDPTGEAAVAIGAGLGIAAVLKGISVIVSTILAVTVIAKAASTASSAVSRPATSRENTATQSQTNVTDVPIVDSRRYAPEPLYFGADTYGGAWKAVTTAMTFDDAVAWTEMTAASQVYGKNAAWGLYTYRQEDAMIMAQTLFPDGYLLPEGEKNQFAHYHPYSRIFRGKYKHFHIWYGELLSERLE